MHTCPMVKEDKSYIKANKNRTYQRYIDKSSQPICRKTIGLKIKEVKIKRNWSPGGKEGFKKAINEVRKDKHLRTSPERRDKEDRKL